MQRFQIDPVGAYGYEARIALSCTTCGWEAGGPDYEVSTTLAELVQRADEHTEVCR